MRIGQQRGKYVGLTVDTINCSSALFTENWKNISFFFFSERWYKFLIFYLLVLLNCFFLVVTLEFADSTIVRSFFDKVFAKRRKNGRAFFRRI